MNLLPLLACDAHNRRAGVMRNAPGPPGRAKEVCSSISGNCLLSHTSFYIRFARWTDQGSPEKTHLHPLESIQLKLDLLRRLFPFLFERLVSHVICVKLWTIIVWFFFLLVGFDGQLLDRSEYGRRFHFLFLVSNSTFHDYTQKAEFFTFFFGPYFLCEAERPWNFKQQSHHCWPPRRSSRKRLH